MPIVWEFPDGHVELEQLEDGYLERNRLAGETTDAAVLRLGQILKLKKPHYVAGSPSATLLRRAEIPVDRSRRNAWRLQDNPAAPGTKLLRDDPSVVLPPKVRSNAELEALVAELDARLKKVEKP